MIAGDFNRSRHSDLRYYLNPLDQMQYSANPSVHRSNISHQSREWDRVLGLCSELETHNFTHFSKEANFESRIDRAFWIVPPWVSRSINLRMLSFLLAHSMNSQGLSDHSPHWFLFLSQAPSSSSLSPHPLLHYSTSLFQTILGAL